MLTRDDGWSLAPLRRAAALAALERHEAAPSEALRALGILSLGREGEVALPHLPALRASAARHSTDVDVQSLTLHLDELVSLLEIDPPEDGYAEASWKDLAERVLGERHGLFLQLAALERLGVDAGPSQESREALARIDGELSAQLWRLTAVNDHRRLELESIAPEHRGETWWYSRGAHLPGSAVGHFGAVAAVAACFPEAREELEALSEAESLLDVVGSSPRAARPVGNDAHLHPHSVEARTASALVADAELVGDPLDEAQFARDVRGTAGRRSKLVSRMGWLLSAASILVVLLGGGAYKRSLEKAERDKASLLQQVETARAAADENVRRLEDQLRTASSLSEAQKAALEMSLARANTAAESVTPRAAAAKSGGAARPSAGARPPTKGSRAKPAGTLCTPGDPMCGPL